MQDELDDHQEEYSSLTNKDWCDLLSTIKVKCDRKIAAIYINKIASDRSASLSESDKYVRILRNEKARLGTGVLCSNKGPRKKAPKHHVTQRH